MNIQFKSSWAFMYVLTLVFICMKLNFQYYTQNTQIAFLLHSLRLIIMAIIIFTACDFSGYTFCLNTAPVIVPCLWMRHVLLSVSRQTVGGFKLGCILQACSEIATMSPAESTWADPFDAKHNPWWSATKHPTTLGVDMISSTTLSSSFSIAICWILAPSFKTFYNKFQVSTFNHSEQTNYKITKHKSAEIIAKKPQVTVTWPCQLSLVNVFLDICHSFCQVTGSSHHRQFVELYYLICSEFMSF